MLRQPIGLFRCGWLLHRHYRIARRVAGLAAELSDFLLQLDREQLAADHHPHRVEYLRARQKQFSYQ